jgi:deoxycytidylate deaminase
MTITKDNATNMEEITRSPSGTTAGLTEIIFGAVAAVGVDLQAAETSLCNILKQFGYELHTIRVSNFIEQFGEKLGIKVEKSPEFKRISTFMDAGNKIRKISGLMDFFALHAVAEILKTRAKNEGLPRKAYFIWSLKRREEVESLRRLYGPGFFLVAFYATEAQRLNYLVERQKIPQKDALVLMSRDHEEGPESDPGQQTRATFALADVFIQHDWKSPDVSNKDLDRFIDLVFGSPTVFPTRDEHAMYLAYAAALRSGSLARQVGASIASGTGDIIATGTNDVPCFGGGLYPSLDPSHNNIDKRDHTLGYDPNDSQQNQILRDIHSRIESILKPQLQDKIEDVSLNSLLSKCKDELALSSVSLITEYHRAVHAELDAIICCARTGASPRGGTMYVTLFSCHNCAKHMIAAGIHRVVFVEPYPKSLATSLHDDAIAVEGELDKDGKEKHLSNDSERMLFKHFVGVAGRRFFDLFAMKWSSGSHVKRKNEDGTLINWQRASASPRLPMFSDGLQQREEVHLLTLEDKVKELSNAKR